jgi:hypothetical protein
VLYYIVMRLVLLLFVFRSYVCIYVCMLYLCVTAEFVIGHSVVVITYRIFGLN